MLPSRQHLLDLVKDSRTTDLWLGLLVISYLYGKLKTAMKILAYKRIIIISCNDLGFSCLEIVVMINMSFLTFMLMRDLSLLARLVS
jgi:hypothetical protein